MRNCRSCEAVGVEESAEERPLFGIAKGQAAVRRTPLENQKRSARGQVLFLGSIAQANEE